MDYLDKYIDLMEQARSRGWPKKSAPVYTEGHHIFPKSWMPNDYIVRLTAQEHFEAHWLLHKAFPEDKNMTYAMWGMFNGNRPERIENVEISAERYAEARIAFAKTQSEAMSGENNPSFGLKHSEETKQKLRDKANRELEAGTNLFCGERHPMFGMPPWRHPRGNELSREIWSKSDEIMSWCRENPEKKCMAMATQFGYSRYSSRVFLNIHKKLKSGWVPSEDPDWRGFFNK